MFRHLLGLMKHHKHSDTHCVKEHDLWSLCLNHNGAKILKPKCEYSSVCRAINHPHSGAQTSLVLSAWSRWKHSANIQERSNLVMTCFNMRRYLIYLKCRKIRYSTYSSFNFGVTVPYFQNYLLFKLKPCSSFFFSK